MSRLILLFLGSPQIKRDDLPVKLDTNKSIALIAHLAITGESDRRDGLVNLLWPDYDQAHGRNILRRTLSSIKKSIGDEWLIAERDTIGLNFNTDIWIDTQQFQHNLSQCLIHGHTESEVCPDCLNPLINAVNLYRGDFLSGFSIKDSINFDDWQFFQTDNYRRKLAGALERIIQCYSEKREYESALGYARQWLTIDRLNESAHCQLMKLYVWAGQRSSALRQYEECVRILEDQMSISPQESTTELYQTIKQGHEPAKFSPQEEKPVPPSSVHPLGEPRRRNENGKTVIDTKLEVTPSAVTLNEEKRMLTVFYVDVRGSLKKESSEGDTEILFIKAVENILSKYGGQVESRIGGSILAVFGMPRIRESDSEWAIRSAIEMQKEAIKQGLDITIGISTGEVYLRRIDSGRMILGTAIDIALRLGKKAEVGRILVDRSTYQLNRMAFEFDPIQLDIDVADDPSLAYEVKRLLPHPEKARGIKGLRAEMVGRDREFSSLKEATDSWLSGQGQIVSIIGEAGAGKSRLVSEMIKDLRLKIKDSKDNDSQSSIFNPQSLIVLEGRCVSIGESIGYWVFVDILRSYMGFSDEDSPAELREKIINKMQAIFPQRWKEIIPYIGNLLSVRFEDELYEKIRRLPPEQIKHQTFMTLRDLFFTLSQQKPLILIFEDLHWADDLSLDMINLLMDVLTLSPLMLICVYRPEKEHKSWHIGTRASGKCLDRYREIMLRALNPYESRRLIESLLAIDKLPESVKQTITDKAGGNPFFVEEVIRSLMERGVVYQDGEKWIAKENINDVDVPDTIQSVIMARIDRLEEDVKSVLQCASVIGRSFLIGLLEKVLEIRENLERSLQRLEHLELIYEKSILPELEYIFKHALTQEVVYDSLLIKRRKEYHERVGSAIEETYPDRLEEFYEVLAYHYSHSDNPEKSVEYLMKAGDKAMKGYSNQEAIGYFSQALNVLDGLEETNQHNIWQITAIESLGRIYQTIGQYEQADEVLKKAFALAVKTGEQPAKLAELQYWRAESLFHLKKYNEAKETGEVGLSFLGENLECLQSANLFHIIGGSWYAKGDYAKAEEYLSKNALIVRKLEYFENIFRIYTGISGRSILMGDMDAAIAWQEESLMICQSHGNDIGVAEAYYVLGTYYNARGDLDKALDCLEKSLRLSERIGYVAFSKSSQGLRAEVMLRLGNDTEAEDYLRMAGSAKLSIWWDPSGVLQYFKFAWIYLNRGDPKKAMEICTDSLNDLTNSESLHSKRLSAILSIMEDAYQALEKLGLEKRDGFISFCRKLREERTDFTQKQKLAQWYLEPRSPSESFDEVAFLDDFDALNPEWKWINPRGDCHYSISDGWLEMRSASGRNLHGGNLNAPRLMLEISGDFAIETNISLASDDTPSVGGLLLWKDKRNFIRFEKGLHGEHEIGFSSNIDGDWQYYGRGLLKSSHSVQTKFTHLRIERSGDTFRAYCSSDGTSHSVQTNWFTCGEISFSVEDPVQIGIHAIGNVGIRGSHAATATKFDYFRVLRKVS